MAAVLFRLPDTPVFNTNGAVVSGALANFYLTGTLNRTPVYSDSALSIEHENPVEANSSGVLPDIYLSSDIDYRVRITDAEGVLISEADPYTDLAAAGILAKLLTVDGSGSGLDADKLRGTTPTAFGLSLIDDAAASDGRTTLGLGTIATQNANNVSITGGAISGITDLAVADGGTGASTATNARTNLGLGTSATVNTGTSGATIPLLDGANTWSASQTFTGTSVGIHSASPTLTMKDTTTAGAAATGLIQFVDSADASRFTISVGSASGVNTISGGIMEFSNTVVRFVNVSTTASAANAFLDSGASNSLLRSTSSLKYKTDVHDLSGEMADLVLSLRPVTYRSKAKADDPDRVHWGFVAEEAAEVLPALIHFDREGAPDGFQYERVIVGLVSVVARLHARVAALEGAA